MWGSFHELEISTQKTWADTLAGWPGSDGSHLGEWTNSSTRAALEVTANNPEHGAHAHDQEGTMMHWPEAILLFYLIFIVFFPLPFSSYIPPSPQQSPHCCPCPWVLSLCPSVSLSLSLSLSFFCSIPSTVSTFLPSAARPLERPAREGSDLFWELIGCSSQVSESSDSLSPGNWFRNNTPCSLKPTPDLCRGVGSSKDEGLKAILYKLSYK